MKLKKTLSLLLVVMLLLAIVPVGVAATEMEEFPLGTDDAYEGLHFDTNAGEVFYSFTPTETGTYTCYSDAGLAVYAYTASEYNSSFQPTALTSQQWVSYQNDTYYTGWRWEMTAGTEYIIEFWAYAGANVYLHKVVEPTAMTVSFGDDEGYVGMANTLSLTYFPIYANPSESVVWTSSDPQIVEVQYGRAIKYISAGTATITATCGDLTATCKATGYDYNILELDIPLTAESIGFGDERCYYKFTPETDGLYRFNCTFDGDTDTIVSGTIIGERNFILGQGYAPNPVYYLTGGKTYSVRFIVNEGSGSLTVLAEKTDGIKVGEEASLCGDTTMIFTAKCTCDYTLSVTGITSNASDYTLYVRAADEGPNGAFTEYTVSYDKNEITIPMEAGKFYEVMSQEWPSHTGHSFMLSAKHDHELTKTEAAAATFETGGNLEYYTCQLCEGLFADNQGTQPTTLEAVTTDKLLHIESKNAVITEEGMQQVLDKAVSEDADVATIELPEAEPPIQNLVLPTSAVDSLVQEQVALTVSTQQLQVTLDAQVLATVASQINSETLNLEMAVVETESLSEAQKTAIAGKNVAAAIQMSICSGSNYIHDFQGGKAQVKIPFTPSAEAAGAEYVVLHVADDGKITEMETEYKDGILSFTTDHFSTFVVAQKEEKTCKHSYTEYKANNDATCEKDGTKTATCAYGCGTTDTVADAGSAKGHDFKTYTADKNATCKADGTKTAKCENCDKTNTVADEGSKADHSYGDDNFCDWCGKDKSNPQTGDNTNLVLLTSVMVISLLMAVALVATMYRTKKAR